MEKVFGFCLMLATVLGVSAHGRTSKTPANPPYPPANTVYEKITAPQASSVEAAKQNWIASCKQWSDELPVRLKNASVFRICGVPQCSASSPFICESTAHYYLNATGNQP